MTAAIPGPSSATPTEAARRVRDPASADTVEAEAWQAGSGGKD